MLENIRKYSALMIIVVALLAFGLIVTLRDGNGAGGSKGDLIVVSGKGLNQKEVDLLTRNPFSLVQASGFIRSEGTQLLLELSEDFVRTSFPGINAEKQAFVPAISLLLAHSEAEKLGIYVSQADAEQFILDKWFVDIEGQRDPSRYNEFAEEGLKSLNMTEASLKEYIVSLLTFAKVKEIKSIKGIPYSIEKHKQVLQRQTADVEVVEFQNALFKITEEPTEQEIKAFYEENKNSIEYGLKYFRTAPKVQLTFIPVNLETLPKEEDETLAASAITGAKKTVQDYNKFLYDDRLVGEKPDLEKLAKEYGLEVDSTALVEAKDLADKFDNYELNRETERFLYDYLVSPDAPNTKKLQVIIPGAYKDRGYIHYRIDSKEESRLKTLEESKEDVITLIREQKQVQAAKDAVKDAITAAEAGLKEGKTLNVSLKGLNAKVSKANDINASSAIPGSDFNGFTVFQAVQQLDAGSFSEVITSNNLTGFVYLKRRTVKISKPEQEILEARKFDLDEVSIRIGNSFKSLKDIGFDEWLVQAYKDAEANDAIKYQ